MISVDNEQTNQSKGNVQSLERALSLLDIISLPPYHYSIKELSEHSGLNKSTVHRLLHTLKEYKYVVQDETTSDYKLGVKLLQIGTSILESVDYRQIARPVLEKYCTDEVNAAHLTMMSNHDIFYIDKVDNPLRSIRMYSDIGKRLIPYCSASGKILVAWRNDYEQIAKEQTFIKYTSTTVPDAQAFLSELEDVRKSGYAIDNLEYENNIFCVAVPLYNFRNELIAAISFTAVSWNVSKDLCEKLRLVAFEAGKEISTKMGCKEYPGFLRISDKENSLLSV